MDGPLSGVGGAAWSFSLPQSIHTLPSLACSNPALTAWCSYFLPWEKRRERDEASAFVVTAALGPALPDCAFSDRLSAPPSPTAAVNSKD